MKEVFLNSSTMLKILANNKSSASFGTWTAPGDSLVFCTLTMKSTSSESGWMTYALVDTTTNEVCVDVFMTIYSGGPTKTESVNKTFVAIKGHTYTVQLSGYSSHLNPTPWAYGVSCSGSAIVYSLI